MKPARRPGAAPVASAPSRCRSVRRGRRRCRSRGRPPRVLEMFEGEFRDRRLGMPPRTGSAEPRDTRAAHGRRALRRLRPSRQSHGPASSPRTRAFGWVRLPVASRARSTPRAPRARGRAPRRRHRRRPRVRGTTVLHRRRRARRRSAKRRGAPTLAATARWLVPPRVTTARARLHGSPARPRARRARCSARACVRRRGRRCRRSRQAALDPRRREACGAARVQVAVPARETASLPRSGERVPHAAARDRRRRSVRAIRPSDGGGFAASLPGSRDRQRRGRHRELAELQRCSSRRCRG